MSAIGQGGVSIISGTTHSELSTITIPNGSSCIFTHNVGRTAFQVLVTDQHGNILDPWASGLFINQTPDVLTVANASDLIYQVYISPRWEENTVELSLIPPGDSRVQINPGSPPIL